MLAEVLTSAASWQDEHPLLTYLVPGELQTELRPGQLVAIPYGERLVEGIVWHVRQDGKPENDHTLRPIHTILDLDPVLWPHQRQLAEWIAEYYITPLAQVALMMLPPGLMQRSKIVLRLVVGAGLLDVGFLAAGSRGAAPGGVSGVPPDILSPSAPEGSTQKNLHLKAAIPPQGEINHTPTMETQLTTRALIGLLLADGELDVERLKEMLGPKRAKEVLREATASGLIEREAQLHPPQAHARHKRVVRLIAHGEVLEAWRQRMETQLRESLVEAPAASMAPDNVRRRPKKSIPDPWAIPGVADALTLKPKSRAGLLAQRQLAAVDLLQHNRSERLSESSLQFFDQPYWTPGMLCKASSLTPAQLQALVRDNVIAIEEIEIRRDPLLGRTIPASSPLPLTPDQQAALEEILLGVSDEMPIQASSRQGTWHPQGPPTSTQPPRATTFGETTPPPDDGAPGTRAGWEDRRNVVARGGGVDAGGPCGCQVGSKLCQAGDSPILLPSFTAHSARGNAMTSGGAFGRARSMSSLDHVQHSLHRYPTWASSFLTKSMNQRISRTSASQPITRGMLPSSWEKSCVSQ